MFGSKRKSRASGDSAEPPSIAGNIDHGSSFLPGLPLRDDSQHLPTVDPDATASATNLHLQGQLTGDPAGTDAASETATPSGHSSSFSSASGSRASDRYDILGEHGRGGLGRVSRAHDRELDRDVAIKELLNRTHVSEVRFFREALITARLEHPGIVPVHEAGRWPDGTPFYAMKLVAGRPLRDLIAERNTVAERLELLHHVIAVADAIAYAHGRNIIHRDLKPANVIVGDFGETVVIDWGLAKDLGSSDDPSLPASASLSVPSADLTNTGSILGTPAYMAPEQARGERVDQRADVFAIGAMLWELCSLQKVPPRDRSQRHRQLHRSGIDHDLVTIIDKAIDDDPACRYQDAAALAADLKAFKAGARIASRNYSLLETLSHWARRHRAQTLAMLLALLATSGGTALYIHNITAEQSRTDDALQHVEATKHELYEQHEDLILKHVELLLTKDPTSALETLDTYRGTRRDRANQLRAEAVGRGVAVMRSTPHTDNIIWAQAIQGRGVMTLSSDGTIARTDNGKLVETLAKDISAKSAWSYSTSRHLLAYSCHSTNICLIDILTDKRYTVNLDSDYTPHKMAFAPSGNRIATISSTGLLRVFDLSGQHFSEVFSAKTDGEGILPANETAYVVGAAGGLSLVTDGGNKKSMLVQHMTDWAMNPSGSYMAASMHDGSITLIAISTFRAIATQAVCHGPVSIVLFFHKSHGVIYLCKDGELGSWQPNDKKTTSIAQLKGSPSAMTIDNDDHYVIASTTDLSVNVIDLQSSIISDYRGMAYRITTLTPPSSGYPYIISADAFGNFRVWPLPPKDAKLVAHANSRFTAVVMHGEELIALTRASEFVSVSPQRGTRVWKSRYQDDLLIDGPSEAGSLATYGFSSKARIWHDSELDQATEIDSGAPIAHLVGLPDRNWLSVDDAGRLIRWTEQGKPALLDERHQAITTIAVTNDHQTAVEATADGAVWSVDLTAKLPVRCIRTPGARITSMTRLPDNSIAIGSANGEVSILHGLIDDQQIILRSSGAIRDIVFSSDGEFIAVGTSGDQVFLGRRQSATWQRSNISWTEIVARARHVILTSTRTLLIEGTNDVLWSYDIDNQIWRFIHLGSSTLFGLQIAQSSNTAFALDIEGNIFSVNLDSPKRSHH